MLDFEQILWGVLLPSVAAGLLLAIAWRAWRPGGGDGRWAGSLAIGAAFLIAYTGLLQFPTEPVAADEFLVWFTPPAALILLGLHRFGRLRIAVRALLAIALVGLVLYNPIKNDWQGPTSLAPVLAPVLAFLIARTLAERLSLRGTARMDLIVLLMVATGLALCTGLSGSQKLAQLDGAICAGLGAALVLNLWRPRICLRAGGASLAWLLLFGLGLCATAFSELKTTDALLLLVAPLLPWLVQLPLFSGRSDRLRAIIGLSLVLLPIAIAVTRCALAWEPDPYADYY